MSDNSVDNTTSTEAAPEAGSEQTFTLEYVQQLRNEAAKHRTAKQAVEDKLKAQHEQALVAAKAEADVKIAEAQALVGAKDIEVAKLKAALELGVPRDKIETFVDSIKGSTVEEVNASAKSLSDLAGGFAAPAASATATDPTQGRGAQPHPLNSDGLLRSITALLK